MSHPEEKILEGLNEEQRRAVVHGEGPLLIVAGAGTGKTQVITRRIAYLIGTKKVRPEEILALTFTEKAAREMEERVDILVPYGYTDFWICTFHAFGDRVLRENALEIGLPPDFQVLSVPEQVIFFREHLFDFPLSHYRPLGNPTRYIQAMLTLINRAKDEDVSPEDYLSYAKDLERKAKDNPEDEALQEVYLKEKEVALCYQKYQEFLAKEGKIDFGDQITLTLKLFREHPSVLKKYQQRFRYILIDEFQDTNYSQFQLVRLLGKEHRNITVVGDDDQCVPPGTLIKVQGGSKKIEEVKPGEKVLTAAGKGYTTYSEVRRIFKKRKKTRFLTFHTEKGCKIEVTDNHKMFCFVPPNSHHFCLDGVTRGGKARVKIHLEMCYRKNGFKSSRDRPLKSSSVLHQVSLQTSDQKTIERLKLAKVPVTKAKKGVRVRLTSSKLEEAGAIAEHLKKITGGILESKFSLGTLNIQHKPALIIPASNVLKGFYLPILQNSKIVYDEVVRVESKIKEETVYDLEVKGTHNFIANKVVIHNSIYKFRGAAISNILGFLDTYSDAQQVVLTRNYRSPQRILDPAYRLIQYNNPDRLEAKNNINKKLIAAREAPATVKFFHYDSILSEAEGVANLIKEKVKNGEYRCSDFAILVRANNDADPFLRALNMNEIPWRFSGNEGLYDQEEIRLLICFLRVIVDPEDSISLYYLAASQIYQMPVRDLALCMNCAKRKNRSLFYVLSHLDELDEVSERLSLESKTTVQKMLDDLEGYFERSVKLSTGEILYQFITRTGFLHKLTYNPSLRNERKVKNIASFFELVQSSTRVLKDDKPVRFVEDLDLLIDAGDNPAVAEADRESDAVNVLTIHKAKGLEFPVVIMVSLINQRFPSAFRREPIPLAQELIRDILPSGDFHRQEERRLFYVGMTRAQNELYLTSARDYGGKRPRKPSPFVLEALNLSPRDVSIHKRSALEVIEGNAPQPIKQEASYRGVSEDEVLTLSHLQIDDYLTCPLKYKYIHVLRVPILQHHAVIYGKALHDAVQGYYRYKMQGRTPSLPELIEFFERSWVNEGFISREHEEKRLQEGKKTLEQFYKRSQRETILPTYVEKEFNFMLDKDRITGRWDRVDDVNGEQTVIIDYKSSPVEDKKKADKRAKSSLQLAIYALAYHQIFGKIPDSVRLHFLETGVVGEVKLDQKDLETTVDKIRQASTGIRKGLFGSQPDYIACRFCPYQSICPDEGNKKYI